MRDNCMTHTEQLDQVLAIEGARQIYRHFNGRCAVARSEFVCVCVRVCVCVVVSCVVWWCSRCVFVYVTCFSSCREIHLSVYTELCKTWGCLHIHWGVPLCTLSTARTRIYPECGKLHDPHGAP